MLAPNDVTDQRLTVHTPFDGVAEQYDWTDANKSSVRAMRAQLAAQYRREDKLTTKSRAMIAASDYIAANVMRPAKTGQELDAWLGITDAQRVRKAGGLNIEVIKAPRSSGRRSSLRGKIGIVIVDAPPEPTYAEQLAAAMERMKVGQSLIAGPFKNAADLRTIQAQISGIAARVWPQNGHTTYSTNADRATLKLTIKRL